MAARPHNAACIACSRLSPRRGDNGLGETHNRTRHQGVLTQQARDPFILAIKRTKYERRHCLRLRAPAYGDESAYKNELDT